MMYRERGERFQDNCIIERGSHYGGSVMVWAGVSLHHRTNNVFIKGNLTAASFQHEVLDTEVILLLRNHRGMQLMHDGAPAHLARTITQTMKISATSPPPPPKSPELNIIENIWDELNRRVMRTGTIPTTLNQRRANSLYEWNNLLLNYVQRYVELMGRRCLVIVNSARGHTRF